MGRIYRQRPAGYGVKMDKDGDGLPDNYFPVSNPLQLDSQLEKALNEILARVASGTAASILNNSEGSGANLLQAVFYPKKQFDNSTEANWIGEMQNLWYFIDPFLNKTSIREDTNQDNVLNLKQDYVTKFYLTLPRARRWCNASWITMVMVWQTHPHPWIPCRRMR